MTMDLQCDLLTEPLIRYRPPDGSVTHRVSLPELFVAMQRDEVGDFPALRPHQRHPWHALLTQLAAIALHHAGISTPPDDPSSWRHLLRALLPDDPDGAAWHLVAPPAQAAFMQPAVLDGSLTGWTERLAADELDMLVTSKNHDLKAARMLAAEPDDWLMALVSLQTQEGFLGAGNYGISRMNGGFASRCAFGAKPAGGWGRRWQRDVMQLLAHREQIATDFGLSTNDGLALVWTRPWDGTDSLAWNQLDPLYIEVCRRVRLVRSATGLIAMTKGSKAARIAAKERNGLTGDAWMPLDVTASTATGELGGKALTITSHGFSYKLASELAFGSKFRPSTAQQLRDDDGEQGVVLLGQGVTRGQGKTEGYHERRIPISAGMRRLLRRGQRDVLAKVAGERIQAIEAIRKVLWHALVLLLNNDSSAMATDPIKAKANVLAAGFEQREDALFFDQLAVEIDADDPDQARLTWLIEAAARAEAILLNAFELAPRSAMRRYKARSAALSAFRGTLRSDKSPLPALAMALRASAASSNDAALHHPTSVQLA